MNRRKPIDALDAAFRTHDLCYERRGRAFLKATAFLSQRQRIDDATKAKAALVNTLFTVTPCIETGKTPRRAGKR